MMRVRSLLAGGSLALLLLIVWSGARAGAPTIPNPAQEQVRAILPALRNSEAEHASGAYLPGIGAVITLDLVRGPNSLPDKPPADGTRDWAIYLMQTFGPKLTAIPPDETIALSIDFFDYDAALYHQLVVRTIAADVSDPTSYRVWLDGQPYGDHVNVEPTASAVTPTIAATTSASTRPTPRPATTTTPNAQRSFRVDFADPRRIATEWTPIGGTWRAEQGGYAQSELGRFDLLTLFNEPLTGSYTLQADMKLIDGEMGGGLLFNAPTNEGKAGAQMVSFTADGTYVQWGSFNESGVFQFAGGSDVRSAADGAWHTLKISVNGARYDVTLDGVVLGRDIPIAGKKGGYFGLLASTSHVLFDDVGVRRGVR
jgi:hypothetical protein